MSPKTQKGVGLPIARATIVLSLATAAALELAAGPIPASRPETALLRDLLDSFHEGDVAVMDRYYCSSMMMALLLSRGVRVCARMHHKRRVDLVADDGWDPINIVWTRPARPGGWTKTPMPRSPRLWNCVRFNFNIEEPGFRQEPSPLPTLTNADVCSKRISLSYTRSGSEVRYSGSRRKRC
ncbi:MAG: hypothetical protein R3C19_25790 [Planctomycetaceae bacterium]